MKDYTQYIGLSAKLLRHLYSVEEIDRSEYIRIIFGNATIKVLPYISGYSDDVTLLSFLNKKPEDKKVSDVKDEIYEWDLMKI